MIWIFVGVGVGLLLGWAASPAESLTPALVGSLVGWLAGCLVHLKRSGAAPVEEPVPAAAPAERALPPSLVAVFLESLRTRREALCAVRPAFEAGDPAALRTIRDVAHKLRGTGLSYGAPEVSEAAGRVEDAPPDGVAALLDELLVVMARAMQSREPVPTPALTSGPSWMDRAEFSAAYGNAVALAAARGNQLFLGWVKLLDLEPLRTQHGEALAERVRSFALMYLSSTLEGTDLVASWSASELVVLFKDTTTNAARGLLSRLEAALAHEVFQAHGGVRVQPQVGWSAQVVDLDRDLSQAVQALSALVGAPAPPALEPAPGSEGAKLLLIDDDETLAEFVSFRLREHGYEVVHVSDGQTALEQVTALQPDLCLVDVHMPGLNGFEVLERLRSAPLSLTIPIVMLTAAGREVDTVRGFELGANDYVVKPFVPGVLLARIQRLLEA